MDKWSLKTKEGSRNLLLLFIVLIFVFALLAQVITTRGFKIDSTDVTIDVRGVDLSMKLYKPANADSSKQLPCIILAHGGSENLNACALVAWEFARRGFVVLNVSAYGAGMSGQPAISDDGRNASTYGRDGTNGYFDALEYARSLSYVDKGRIAMWGHSAGYLLVSKAIFQDQDYYTMNDRMLNILHDTFQIGISEEQLVQNADIIASNQLSKENLAVYQYMRQEQQVRYDGYVKAARISASQFNKKVMVAGHEVLRDPQCNLMVGLGTHENPAAYYVGETKQYKAAFHTGEVSVERKNWYATADYTLDTLATSQKIGEMFTTTSSNTPTLKTAVENRSARLLYSPETFHSGNEWGKTGITEDLEFFTQALQYNNGNFSDASTKPISTQSLTCYYALLCTTLAFFSMIGMLIALASILLKSKFFSPCVRPMYSPSMTTKDSKFWIACAASVLAGFFGAYMGTLENLHFQVSNAMMSRFFPCEPGHIRMLFIIMGTAVAGIVLFVILSYAFRKKQDTQLPTLASLNIASGWMTVLKAFLLCSVLFAACYITELIMNALFQQRYVILDGCFDLMKPSGFMRMLKYTIILLPWTFLLSLTSNLTILKDVSDTKDTIISVVVNSLGAFLLLGIGWIMTYSSFDHGVVFALHGILSLVILIPVTNYLYRKLFKMTGGVWTGAFVVAALLGWRLASYISHMFLYYGPDKISAFWGIY
ncbi:prolyl oligopeptidase family serine peptidase [uncultured Sphaerochaeta sp.]|uniref:alpha/beta hydrolase n=1 Tax=uncultured Sphaerochaeta sp. TaxID=886478 RepID=UPI002A0A79DD|nr:prolyl oligopeptidase family serine peptidase [uncultured Sphaerochaeta sp.]